MTRSIVRLTIVAPAIFITVLSRASADAASSRVEPIVVARHRDLGSVVSVIGSVTVPSGAFDGGFAIQGLVDGIYVADSAGAERHVGDVVRVTGALVDNFGLLSIEPTSVDFLFRAPPLPPRAAKTGAVGESTEGRLLHLRGTMRGPLVDDSPYGYKLVVDDGSGPIQIFLYPGAGIGTAGLVDGAHIDTQCFSSEFETTYECDPPNAAAFHVD